MMSSFVDASGPRLLKPSRLALFLTALWLQQAKSYKHPIKIIQLIFFMTVLRKQLLILHFNFVPKEKAQTFSHVQNKHNLFN